MSLQMINGLRLQEIKHAWEQRIRDLCVQYVVLSAHAWYAQDRACVGSICPSVRMMDGKVIEKQQTPLGQHAQARCRICMKKTGTIRYSTMCGVYALPHLMNE